MKRMPDNVAVLRNRMETHKHQVSLLNALEAVLMADLYSLVDKSTQSANTQYNMYKWNELDLRCVTLRSNCERIIEEKRTLIALAHTRTRALISAYHVKI